MYRSSLLALFFSLASIAPAQTVVFQAETQIATADLSEAKPKVRKLREGYDASISPDGTKVAYTQSDEDGNRRIAIYDLATGKSSLVKGIEGKNEFGAIWSSDGKKLLFSHFDESDWSLASVNASGGDFQIVIDKATRQVAGFANIPGTSDWLCHDLAGFFIAKIGESGPAKISDLPKDKPVEGLSMPAHLSISPDGKTALFDKTVDEEAKPEDEGPPSAVFQIEIATGKITRVTPKGIYADFPTWLPGGKEFLFGSFNAKTQTETIHRMSIEPGSNPVLVLNKARNPSVSSSQPVLTKKTVTYVKCVWYTGSSQLYFKDSAGQEIIAGVMDKAQRTGMAPDEFYVKFPEKMIGNPGEEGPPSANKAMVGKKFLLLMNAEGDVVEIQAAR